jgi:hypothetical protein
MSKKKNTIRDQYGRRVLIDAIAAYKHDGYCIFIDLRSGAAVTRLAWTTREKAAEAANTIDKFFNFI